MPKKAVKKAVKARHKTAAPKITHHKPKIIHRAIIQPKVIKMVEKKEKNHEAKTGDKKDATGIQQEVTSVVGKPSEFGKAREAELAASTPEAIAAAAEKKKK